MNAVLSVLLAPNSDNDDSVCPVMVVTTTHVRWITSGIEAVVWGLVALRNFHDGGVHRRVLTLSWVTWRAGGTVQKEELSGVAAAMSALYNMALNRMRNVPNG